jgi:hypothetical protein
VGRHLSHGNVWAWYLAIALVVLPSVYGAVLCWARAAGRHGRARVLLRVAALALLVPLGCAAQVVAPDQGADAADCGPPLSAWLGPVHTDCRENGRRAVRAATWGAGIALGVAAVCVAGAAGRQEPEWDDAEAVG